MMNALPHFAQLQPPPSGQAATASALSLLSSGDSGDVLSGFNAVLVQTTAPAADALVPGTDHPSGSGQFQDVNVLLQLLRSAPPETAALEGGIDAALQPAQKAPTAAPSPLTPATDPICSQNGQPMMLTADQLRLASAQDVLDMAARLALPASLPIAAPDRPLVSAPAETQLPSAADLQAAMQKLSGGTSDALPAMPAPSADAAILETSVGDAAESEAPAAPVVQQHQALDILLSLATTPTSAQAAATPAHGAAAPTAQSKSSLHAGVAATDMTSLLADDGAEILLPSSHKPLAQPVAATPPKTPATPLIDANAAPAPARAAAAPTPPAPAAINAPAATAPTTDMGAAMSVLVNAPTGSTAPSAMVQAAENTAPLSEHWLDMSSDDAWIEQLAKDIAATKSATGDLSFRLMPRHLGRLDVSMMHSDQGVAVRMEAQQENTVALVAAAQGRLVEELRQQGVRVAGAEVTHSLQENDRQHSQGQGRGSQNDVNHLIEIESERLLESKSDDKGRTDLRGRFA
jgi:flagellar hook-length control protein FliK